MEPIEILVGTSIALILSEASKEGGKSLGKAASEQLSKLRKLIASKLGKQEGALSNYKPEILEGELVEAFETDSEFAAEVADVIELAQAQPELRQVILENTKGKSLKLNDITQKGSSTSQNTTQIIGSGLEIDGDISISNVTQE